MGETGRLLSAVCDEYCRQQGVKLRLQQTLKRSMNAKGRLLHYFATQDPSNEETWCAWHNDHGSLTALAPGMYFDKDRNKVDNPDPENAGLYIQSRSGEMYKVDLPADVCAFQIGETSQIQSGGVLQATPH